MTLATRKASFIKKNGDPCTIIRNGDNINTRARIIAAKRKTDFFSLNYLREGIFATDSGVEHGDLIRNKTTAEQFFVMSLQNKTVGESVVSIDTELYMVNRPAASILRPRDVSDGKLNKVGTTWEPVATLLANVQHVRGGEQYKVGLLLPTTEVLFTIQASTDVKLDDRVDIGEPRAYKIDDINATAAPGLLIIQLAPDSRK